MIVNDASQAEIRILHVEDDDDDALIVWRMLRQGSAVVHLTRVENGEAARRHVLETVGTPLSVEMIVLDLNMPVMDGETFLRWLRADHRFDHVPVIVLTTTRERDVLKNLLAAGANAAVSKDFDNPAQDQLKQIIVDLWFHGRVDDLKRELDD